MQTGRDAATTVTGERRGMRRRGRRKTVARNLGCAGNTGVVLSLPSLPPTSLLPPLPLSFTISPSVSFSLSFSLLLFLLHRTTFPFKSLTEVFDQAHPEFQRSLFDIATYDTLRLLFETDIRPFIFRSCPSYP